MLIAQTLFKQNIAEYLLYMWQVEDIIRTNAFDITRIRQLIIDRYEVAEDVKEAIISWYQQLIAEMQQQGIDQKGHLSRLNDLLADLTRLHNELLKSADEKEYDEAYYKTLPFIIELRAKSSGDKKPEIETCFSALYGYLLLKLRKQEISGETQAAIAQITSLLRILAAKYKDQQSK